MVPNHLLTFLFKNAVRQWQLQGCKRYLTVDQNGISMYASLEIKSISCYKINLEQFWNFRNKDYVKICLTPTQQNYAWSSDLNIISAEKTY